jgi:hypothetical protein
VIAAAPPRRRGGGRVATGRPRGRPSRRGEGGGGAGRWQGAGRLNKAEETMLHAAPRHQPTDAFLGR